MGSRNNSFDLIRHFAALLVLYSHHYSLTGSKEPLFFHWETLGFIAVAMFFAISGYFMPASYTSSGNFLVFMTKRCRRLFPGIIVCTLFMCFIIAPIFTSLPLIEYFLSPSTYKTSLMYIAFIARPIPGVFTDFIYPEAINGSLWSVPVEFTSYVIIGLALYYVNSVKTVLTLFLFSIMSTMFFLYTGLKYSICAVSINHLALFGIAFTAGGLLSMTKEHWMPIRLYMVGVSLAMLFVLQGQPEIAVLGTLSIAVITVIIGASFQERLINGRFDLSYGIYIYAFPIQQLVINLVTVNFWQSFFLAMVLTLFAAFLSYHFVEKRFLYANSRQRAKTIPVSEETASVALA